MRRVATFGAMLAMVTGLAGGCADIGQEPTSPQSLPQGLTVLDARDTSLSIAYKKENVVIYLQANRGRMTPQMYQQDPLSPKYEVDTRFLADNGRIFWVQRGGDNFVDPTWLEDLKRQEDLPPTRVSNRVLFDMAAEAVTSLSTAVAAQIGSDRADAASPELRAMSSIGLRAQATYARMRVKLEQHRLEMGLTMPVEIAYGDSAGPEPSDYSAGAGYYYIRQFDGYIGVDGWHTATRLYKWSGSSWAFAFDACNHGRCPVEMESDCLLQYYEAVEDYKPTWTLHSCDTPYDLTSDDGGHNCHDDTRLQMASFVYGKTFSGYTHWCNGQDDSTDISSLFFGDQSGTPECDASANEGFNHPSWCDYNYGGGSCPASYQGTNDGCDCDCTFPDGTMADPDCA